MTSWLAIGLVKVLDERIAYVATPWDTAMLSLC